MDSKSPKVSVDTKGLPRPKFEIDKRNDSMPPEFIERVVEFMNWNAKLAVYDLVNAGRSLYVFADFNSEGQHYASPVKLKGAAGLRVERTPERRSIIMPPQPKDQYSPVRQPHFIMRPDYELGAVLSPRKSKYSMTRAGANNEYNLHEKANAADIAFPSIVSGRFSGETDVNGDETGAVAIAADHNYKPVADYNRFSVHELDGKNVAVLSATESRIVTAPLSVVSEMQQSLNESMATIKRRSLLVAGISSHAGHEGNYLLHPETKHMVITDLDTARDLSKVDKDVRPFSVLRDVSHDLWRCISRFMLRFGTTDETIDLIQHDTTSPIYGFLKGFFGTSMSEAKVQEESRRLAALFQGYMRERVSKIQGLRDSHVTSGTPMSQSEFSMQFYQFYPECIVTCQRLLCEDEEVKSKGFILPNITEQDLRRKGERGVEQFYAIAEEESDRGVAQMTSEGKEPKDYF